MPVVSDPFLCVVFDANVLVLLGVHEDLFAAFLIFEPEFVEATTALAAVGFDGGDRRILRKRIGRLGFAIVNRASDDWPIGIAIEELDDDFLADAGDEDRAPILSGPR